MERIGIYPGTFDPITCGHIDIIERSLRIFDKVIIAVSPNPKKESLFSIKERLEMIREVTKGYKKVEIDSFAGLLVDYVKKKGAIAIIRGLRAVSDFEYEFQMALMNRKLDHQIETVFLMPSEEYSYLTSSVVKEIASLGGRVTELVPQAIEERLREKFKNKPR